MHKEINTLFLLFLFILAFNTSVSSDSGIKKKTAINQNNIKNIESGVPVESSGSMYMLPKGSNANRLPRLSGKNFVLISRSENIQVEKLRVFLKQEEENLQNFLQRMNMSRDRLKNIPQLKVNLWDSFEKKTLTTKKSDLRHTNFLQNEIHIIWTESIKGDDFFAEAQWFLKKLFVETKSLALQEGLTVALTNNWHGSHFMLWASRMVASNNVVSIDDLFKSEIWRAESPLARQPLLGALVSFLLDRYKPHQFENLYNSWPERGILDNFPNNDTWEKIKFECHAAVLSLEQPHSYKQAKQKPVFQKGFCYAHEGYQVFNGYMGSRSDESLKKMATLGVNAISVTPFGYLKDPNRPDFFRRSSRPGSENDESLLAAMTWAKEHGMHVMLKPHILMSRPDWGWPGQVVMKSPKDWQTFFDRYERWIRHYAILAELYNFDSFCIGVELEQTTLEHEMEWRGMIARIRKLYSGPIVYAANWGKEFENLKFWDALDAIAVDCYYPLSNLDIVDDTNLLAGARKIADKIKLISERYNKKVIITEVGFASREKTWQEPFDDNRRGIVDLDAQRRCYEAIFQAFWNQSWLAGLYWWKWPTYLENGGPRDNQFTPNGKPAAQIVSRWYKQRLEK